MWGLKRRIVTLMLPGGGGLSSGHPATCARGAEHGLRHLGEADDALRRDAQLPIGKIAP